jgi:hypothetical protein
LRFASLSPRLLLICARDTLILSFMFSFFLP